MGTLIACMVDVKSNSCGVLILLFCALLGMVSLKDPQASVKTDVPLVGRTVEFVFHLPYEPPGSNYGWWQKGVSLHSASAELIVDVYGERKRIPASDLIDKAKHSIKFEAGTVTVIGGPEKIPQPSDQEAFLMIIVRLRLAEEQPVVYPIQLTAWLQVATSLPIGDTAPLTNWWTQQAGRHTAGQPISEVNRTGNRFATRITSAVAPEGLIDFLTIDPKIVVTYPSTPMPPAPPIMLTLRADLIVEEPADPADDTLPPRPTLSLYPVTDFPSI